MEISIKCNEEELKTIINEANIFKNAIREISGNSCRVSEMKCALLSLQQKINDCHESGYVGSEVTHTKERSRR